MILLNNIWLLQQSFSV